MVVEEEEENIAVGKRGWEELAEAVGTSPMLLMLLQLLLTPLKSPLFPSALRLRASFFWKGERGATAAAGTVEEQDEEGKEE